ncbi:unnamed protein product [Caenorhabditis sp. 36 PRJEB53466]|nr:unnamed protein product [Caenorhabditis sp. 36 PRJEB53466]
MCSTFMHKNSYTSAYSKSQYEAPKQLLELRSRVKPLLSPDSCTSSDSVFSHSSLSPRARPEHQKLHLAFIEKDRRVNSSTHQFLKMKPSMQQYQAYDRPTYSRKTTLPPLMRTPSSGFSSSSSSENMFSGLTISASDEPKYHDLLDPTVEPISMPGSAPSIAGSRGNMSNISGYHSQNVMSRQPTQYKPNPAIQPNPYGDYSYSNVKRSVGYTDFLPQVAPAGAVRPQTSVPTSSAVRCPYCWESYVKLCQRVANLDPVIHCDGPWQWHSLLDSQGRVTCPRLWFTQLDRAGEDMLAQMAIARNAPV